MNDPAQRLTEATRRRDHPNLRPRDAATLIIVDASGKKPKVLMGRRHERHSFMPGKFVFPGGRVDPADVRLTVPEELHPAVGRKLLVDMKRRPSPSRARGLALAAVRETYEETGLVIGTPGSGGIATRSPAWRDFLSHGCLPSLSPLRFITRAITPPRRNRRYDTRFFCVGAEAIAHRVETGSQELLDLHWLTFAEALKLDLPSITEVVLEELEARLRASGLPQPEAPVPYYFMSNGRFRRDLI
ncbi:MAG: NUDIX hydrolase [Hyphomicrobiales bacterium]|nr:NUDIX hydrolase [Hyphomicrobiales bacterium]